MKKEIYIFLFLLSLHLSGFSQTASDWTKTDCASANHNLYSYLDNEEVVIMEFAMGCGSCTDAATLLLSTKNKYALSNPGKVKVFYMDYWAGNDCAVEVAVATTGYAFDATFDHCSAEKDFYFTTAGSPMPGIVIAAGSAHQIIYQLNNFSEDDTLLIEQAINTFFANVGMNEHSLGRSADVYPNPTENELTVSFQDQQAQETKISLFNVNGQLISEIFSGPTNPGETKIKTDISRFSRGMYYIRISNKTETVNKKIVIL